MPSIEQLRAKHSKCYYCGGSIRKTPAHDVMPVADREALAHRDCLAAAPEDVA